MAGQPGELTTIQARTPKKTTVLASAISVERTAEASTRARPPGRATTAPALRPGHDRPLGREVRAG